MENTAITSALNQKSGFEAVSNKGTDKQLRLLGRVPNALLPTWLQLIQRLLSAAETATWDLDVSKQYFLRGGKLVFGWRLIFQGEDLSTHFSSVVAIINSVQRVQQVLDEVPLYSNPNRNSLSGTGKGAQPSGSAVVGPLAMQQIRRG